MLSIWTCGKSVCGGEADSQKAPNAPVILNRIFNMFYTLNGNFSQLGAKGSDWYVFGIFPKINLAFCMDKIIERKTFTVEI